MYQIHFKTHLEIEPWNTDLPERLATARAMSGKKKIIYIYEKPDTSTFRYRVYNMCQSLRHSHTFEGVYFFEKELPLVTEIIETASVLVFVRTRWSSTLDTFLQIAKKHRKPIVFDSDDLVFDISSIPLIMNTLGADFSLEQNYSYWFSYVSRLWFMASKCDAYIATNSFLAQKLEQVFHKETYIVENFLNDEQISVSKTLYDHKKQTAPVKPFQIGYFSGSPSHVNDFRQVAPEIAEFLQKNNDVTVKVLGFIEFPHFLSYFVQTKRILYAPLVDFLTLQREMACVDVNIVPLLDNQFTNCKSDLKFFEASIVGTLTCATPVYAYRKAISHGRNGFLCRPGEWYDALNKAYTSDISKVIDNAREHCLRYYSPHHKTNAIEEVFSTIARL